MSEIQIDHETAKRKAEFCQSYPALFKKQEANLCRAYLDLQRQLAAERARVEALCDVISDANGIAYPFAEMQDKMTAILNAHAQGD